MSLSQSQSNGTTVCFEANDSTKTVVPLASVMTKNESNSITANNLETSFKKNKKEEIVDGKIVKRIMAQEEEEDFSIDIDLLSDCDCVIQYCDV